MSLPSLMYRLGTIYFLFHLITLSPQNFLSLYADLHKIWQIVSSTLDYSIASPIRAGPKVIFYHFLQALFAMISTGTEALDLLRFWRKHPCRGPQWKGTIPSITGSLPSTVKRVRIWGQPRGTTVGGLCLQGSLAAAELEDFGYQVDSWVVSGTVFCVMTIHPS